MRLITLAEVDSTNSEARRLLEAGHPPDFAVSADRQTVGRGRLQRSWKTLPGNVSLTITAPWDANRAGGPTIALATGLAIYRIIAHFVGDRGVVSIKWPNDVLVDGRKISGTLIEAGTSAICVGIGINVASTPELDGYPVVSLSQFSSVNKHDMIEGLLTTWPSTYDRWREGGFREIITDYNRHLYFYNQAMRLSLDRDKQVWISGICRGTDEHGCLVIEGADGTRKAYSVGDVERPLAEAAER